jgi:polyisoprenoid-binding protein YceI
MKLILSLLLIASSSYAAPLKLKSSSADFKLGYTMGTHEGKTQAVTGFLDLETGTGEFQVPITTIKTGNSEMDCHMYESLGINYKNSDFPDKHVCEDDNVPSSGPNSIVYPNVSYKITSIETLNKTDNSYDLKVMGAWVIHGKSVPKNYQLTLNKKDNTWKTKLDLKLSLKEFDVIVKKFLFIGVEDTVKLTLNMNLES